MSRNAQNGRIGGRIAALGLGALVSWGLVGGASAQTWSMTGGKGTWQAPSSMQSIPYTSRGSWVRMPFVVQGQPWVYAPGGNRPFEREAPDRFQPKPPPPVPTPLPSPTPSAIDPNGTYPGAPSRGGSDGVGSGGMDAIGDVVDADIASGAGGVISLPTTSGVSIGGGPIGVNMGTNWGWGASSGIHRDASTGYLTGWNQPGSSYGTFDPRLSVHYKPSEIAEIRARDRAEAVEAQRTYMDRGMSALAKGDLELAEQLLSEQLRETPEDVELIRRIGVIELMLKRTDAGVKRIASAYAADPLLCERPIDLANFGGSEAEIRRAASDVAVLASRAGRADAGLSAAALAQARGNRVVASRFLDRAAEGGLDPILVARFRSVLTPPEPRKTLEQTPETK